ncbi:MAG: acriflavine resistance protein B [Polyangiaceae bacterium UTPRO1]|jgi:multidrug efflux pump subunit AcrB|nr:efflux RND transporter permease subunit [Myxococcales bacterium]OQY69237.1 MAG: acriflavine resistance protein B [Polyangiaceae bacterium UTPRO1]
MPSFAIRNPHLIIVGALITVLLGLTALVQMPVDVFPSLKIPAVVVATFYPGMPPTEVERNITTRFERFFTLGSDIEHTESRSLPGVSIIKVFFHPDADIDAAAASIANLAMANLRHLPPGTLPPLVLKSGASSLPVTLVTVAGAGFSEAQLRDQAQYNVRNQLATVAGASVPPPFGGKYRQMMVYADRQALQARGLTLMDVVHSLNDANLIIPAGDAKIGNTDYFVHTNSMIEDPAAIDDVPLKVGAGAAPVLVRDVAHTEDASQIQQNVVRIDGQRSVYVPILKQSNANTIAVVDGVRDVIGKIAGLPQGMKLQPIFDQSGYIRAAIASLRDEAGSAALLASLVILLFLGSFKSTIAIFLSIPLSLLGAAFAMFCGGSTVNVMTLGGFALAIGRLVDNSVVVLENINRHLSLGKGPQEAARDGAEEVALPVLASTLTTVIVFFPVMFLFGVAKYLFSALSLAVVLSMIASYVVAMTVIPIYCARFLTSEEAQATEEGGGRLAGFSRAYERFADRYEGWLALALEHKGLVIGAVTGLFVLAMVGWRHLGTELFPRTDAGQFIIDLRAPLGSRIEVTEALADKVEAVVREVIPKDDLDVVVSNLGLAPGFSAIYSPNAASDSGVVMVSLKPEHRGSTWQYLALLRERLRAEVPEVEPFFQSGSIIDSVLDFGLAAPIDVQLSGPRYDDLHAAARTIERTARRLSGVADVFVPQEAGYPTLDVNVDRLKAARLGLSQRDVVSNTITALTSNQMIAPSIWIDPANGNDYFLTVQYPERDIRSLDTLLDIPVRRGDGGAGRDDALMLRSVATVSKSAQPAEADHYDIQRVVDVLIAPRGDDMGGTQREIREALRDVHLPADVRVTYRGAVAAMEASFTSFGFGLAMAVALLYLVMVAQFRSFLDPVIIMFAVPMGMIGVVAILLATDTTLNIESFMGIIAMVGIVVSNSILLVDFANRRRRAGVELRRAVLEAARTRMRPIVMTALATIVGLVPIALALGAGAEASAPLARAAVGGLTVSTALTLVLVPVAYELFCVRRTAA